MPEPPLSPSTQPTVTLPYLTGAALVIIKSPGSEITPGSESWLLHSPSQGNKQSIRELTCLWGQYVAPTKGCQLPDVQEEPEVSVTVAFPPLIPSIES